MLDRDVLPRWGAMMAADVTRPHVRQLLDEVVDRGAPVQANRILAFVRKLYSFALSRDLVEHNPCIGIARPTAEKPRERVLSAEELRALNRQWRDGEREGDPFARLRRRVGLLDTPAVGLWRVSFTAMPRVRTVMYPRRAQFRLQ